MWALPDNQSQGVTGPLITCVADYGTAIVIPGADETACDRAGLDRFDGRIAADILAAGDVEDELSTRITNGECMDAVTATTTLRQALDEHGLTKWAITVNTDPTLTGDTCSVFGFDEATATATVIPMAKETQ
jgi:hypothetical protein